MLGVFLRRGTLTPDIQRWFARVVRSRRTAWAMLVAGFLMALLLFGAAAVALRRDVLQQRLLDTQVESLKMQIAAREHAAAADAVQGGSTSVDFVQRLPATPDVRMVLIELERSTAAAGVAFGGVQAQERVASTEQLARVDLTVSLRGNYPKLKEVLTDLLGRFPNVTLAQWRLRKINQPGELEATMVLALWGASTGLGSPASGGELAGSTGAR